MTKEEMFSDILSTVGEMTIKDKEEVAHSWFSMYNNEFLSADRDRQRCLASLYTLIRDYKETDSAQSKPIFELITKYKKDDDATKLCKAIDGVMRKYNGTKEHFFYVWRAAALPCSLESYLMTVKDSLRADHYDEDLHNILANL